MPKGSKKLFFQTWSCSISNQQRSRAEQNASKIFILVKLVTLRRVQILLDFGYHVNFKFLYQTLCVFSKDRKLSFCCEDHAPGMGLWGAGGNKN